MTGGEVVRALDWRERIQQCADRSPERVYRARGGFAEPCLKLGEELFDGIEIRRIRRQVQHGCARGSDRLADAFDFVATEVVEDHNVSGTQRWGEKAAGVGQKHLAIHRSVGDHRRDQAILTESPDEGGGGPVPMRCRGHAALPARGPAAPPRHIGGCRCFVNEDELFEVQLRLVFPPQTARLLHVGSILLAGVQGFF